MCKRRSGHIHNVFEIDSIFHRRAWEHLHTKHTSNMVQGHKHSPGKRPSCLVGTADPSVHDMGAPRLPPSPSLASLLGRLWAPTSLHLKRFHRRTVTPWAFPAPVTKRADFPRQETPLNCCISLENRQPLTVADSSGEIHGAATGKDSCRAETATPPLHARGHSNRVDRRTIG